AMSENGVPFKLTIAYPVSALLANGGTPIGAESAASADETLGLQVEPMDSGLPGLGRALPVRACNAIEQYLFAKYDSATAAYEAAKAILAESKSLGFDQRYKVELEADSMSSEHASKCCARISRATREPEAA